jgi:hypothetical protein
VGTPGRRLPASCLLIAAPAQTSTNVAAVPHMTLVTLAYRACVIKKSVAEASRCTTTGWPVVP